MIDGMLPEDTDAVADLSLDENLSPFFALLNKISEIAPPVVKDVLKQELLPREEYPRCHAQLISGIVIFP
jgi:hypothetical protein